MLESTVNVEDNLDENSHASAVGEAKNCHYVSAKHTAPHFASGEWNYGQDHDTHYYSASAMHSIDPLYTGVQWCA